VRLTSTARVEGDIIHKTIAIESGAHFEGSVQRQDDPLATAGQIKQIAAPAK
jgi:cytoskeletal protein CcmA (bactofilin family)